MPATLTAINPTTANPGDPLTLTGTGFIAGAVVIFAASDTSFTDLSPQITSDTQLVTTAPDLGGDATALQVSVTAPDEGNSAAVPLQLNAWPPVDQILPLVGLAALKRTLGLGVDEKDADNVLRTLITAASAQLYRIVTVDLQPVTVTNELYDGDGTSRLDLRRQPVRAVAALSIDGQAVDITTVKVYPGYIAFDNFSGGYNPRLRASGQIFGMGNQNVCVSYSAGFTLVPADLALACIEQVSFLRNTLGRQGLLSDTNSAVQATSQYAQLTLAPAARIAANRYRKERYRVV